MPQNAIRIELCLRLTGQSTTLAFCNDEGKTKVGEMKRARSTPLAAARDK
jgi:hypothetical protein